MNTKELRKIAEAATKGPWDFCERHNVVHARGGCKGQVTVVKKHNLHPFYQKHWESDAKHIATFNPTTVLKLLDALDALRDECSEAADLIESMEGQIASCDRGYVDGWCEYEEARAKRLEIEKEMEE